MLRTSKACSNCKSPPEPYCDGPCPEGAHVAIPEAVTKSAVEGFETIKITGQVNMFSRLGVQRIAQLLGFNNLAYLLSSEYVFILNHYRELREHYQVERGKICFPR